MVQEILKAFFFIFIAEMGDKTQILAMTFAARYNSLQVLIGIFIGVLLNHGIAIAIGNKLACFIPVDKLQIIAGVLFIIFGLWTLKVDKKDDNNRTKIKFGPIFTVALAFFIGELGDKTQLTALTLAMDAEHPTFILMGTIMGMLVTGGIGIFIGSKIANKLSETSIKIVSSAIFIICGTVKLFYSTDFFIYNQYRRATFIIIIALIAAVMISKLLKRKR